MIWRYRDHGRHLAAATITGQGAARMKPAARRRRSEIGRASGKANLGRIVADARQACDQVLGIGMLR
jgi:hypothetical protein